jgi:uncharacterized protein (DUF983 family)
MPNFFQTPFDTALPVASLDHIHETERMTRSVILPSSGRAALLRGLRGNCPRCGQARLFRRFLKPILSCPQCGQDWSHQQADDFPAYVSIFATGHLMAPLIIALIQNANLSAPILMAITMPVAILLMIGLLQPAKGAIIALQWWLGMHGFDKERPPVAPIQAK